MGCSEQKTENKHCKSPEYKRINLLKSDYFIGKKNFDFETLFQHQKNVYCSIYLSIVSICERLKSFPKPKPVASTDQLQAIQLDRPVQIFSILGGRGVGKTSTMTSLWCELNENRDILLLPILDPEVLDRYETAGIAFSSLMLEKLDGGEDKCTIPVKREKLRRELYDFVEEGMSRREDIRSFLVSSAGSLKAFTKMYLTQRSQYANRQQVFYTWINDYLDVLGKQMLVLFIDDADTAADRLSDVLALLRYFLCHPRIAVVISADYLELLRTIKNSQLKETGMHEYSDAVVKNKDAERLIHDELIHIKQYAVNLLEKILPPVNRHHMPTMKRNDIRKSIVSIINNFFSEEKEIDCLQEDKSEKKTCAKEFACSFMGGLVHNDQKSEVLLGEPLGFLNCFMVPNNDTGKLFFKGFAPTNLRGLTNFTIKLFEILIPFNQEFVKLGNGDENAKEKIKARKELLFKLIILFIDCNQDIQYDLELFYSMDEKLNIFDAQDFDSLKHMFNELIHIRYAEHLKLNGINNRKIPTDDESEDTIDDSSKDIIDALLANNYTNKINSATEEFIRFVQNAFQYSW